MTEFFGDLGLSPALVRATADRGYAQPTPIQSAAIPAALAGHDLLATAHTGTGKTAAFGLPLLQQIERAAQSASASTPRRGPRRLHGLIVVPTRELATQVGESLRGLAQHLAEPVKVSIVFGGVSINPQMMVLRGGADVVVATPGRLLDLIDHNALSLVDVAVLVLDEADRLFDAGFADELARILGLLPVRRQNLLFSATFPIAVQTLAKRLLREPVRIDLQDAPAAPVADGHDDSGTDVQAAIGTPQIDQHAVQVDAARRTQLLRHLLNKGRWKRVLVFVATRHATEHVAGKLRGLGIEAAAFHGELSQGARTQALTDFKTGTLQVLVATDVAARGIDIAQLSVVVNYDLPRAALDYVHRIGRTGRAGAIGLAISFISADSAAAEAHFRLIEKRQGQRIKREQIVGFEPTAIAQPVATEGGVKGLRKSKKDKLREAASAVDRRAR